MPEYLPGLEFDDVDLLAQGVGWEVDFRQLDAGRFSAAANLVATPGVTVMRISLGRDLHQRGLAPSGTRTYGLVDPDAPDVRWHGVDACGGLLDFNDPGGFDGVSSSGMRGLTLSIDESLLTETAVALGLDGHSVEKAIGPVWHDAGDGRLFALRHRLQALVSDNRHAQNPLADREFEQSLASEVLMLTSPTSTGPAPESWRRHRRVLDRALEHIEGDLEGELTVATLCSGIGVSNSTLERVFRSQLGTTPKKYINRLRLQRARRDLVASGDAIPIADIANRWGFWHLGQFARDYRRQFHELPRDTARLRARSVQTVELACQGPTHDPQ